MSTAMAWLLTNADSSSFFFSSRRRHTRSLCDWSSDVCSSDLKAKAQAPRPGCQAGVRAALDRLPRIAHAQSQLVTGDAQTATCAYRAGGERLTVEIQSVPQAYLVYETASVHQVQANVGRSDTAPANSYPKQVDGVGVLASWIPSERQLITTNGTPRR